MVKAAVIAAIVADHKQQLMKAEVAADRTPQTCILVLVVVLVEVPFLLLLLYLQC